MYSPVVVAGSNTHNMAKTKNNKKTVNNRQQHLFRGCREAIVANSGGLPTASALKFTSSSGGQGSFTSALSTIGLGACTYSASNYVVGVQGNVCAAPLRGLFNRASDFQWYRVTRAKLVFVGLQGTTITGIVTLAGYADPSDVGAYTPNAFVSGANTRTFDIANAGSREVSVPIPVDSSWKKVSWVLSQPGNWGPFQGSGTSTIVPVATVSDLCFGAISVAINGAPASTDLGYMYIDYDVEFKGPVDPTINL